MSVFGFGSLFGLGLSGTEGILDWFGPMDLMGWAGFDLYWLVCSVGGWLLR